MINGFGGFFVLILTLLYLLSLSRPPLPSLSLVLLYLLSLVLLYLLSLVLLYLSLSRPPLPSLSLSSFSTFSLSRPPLPSLSLSSFSTSLSLVLLYLLSLFFLLLSHSFICMKPDMLRHSSGSPGQIYQDVRRIKTNYAHPKT